MRNWHPYTNYKHKCIICKDGICHFSLMCFFFNGLFALISHILHFKIVKSYEFSTLITPPDFSLSSSHSLVFIFRELFIWISFVLYVLMSAHSSIFSHRHSLIISYGRFHIHIVRVFASDCVPLYHHRLPEWSEIFKSQKDKSSPNKRSHSIDKVKVYSFQQWDILLVAATHPITPTTVYRKSSKQKKKKAGVTKDFLIALRRKKKKKKKKQGQKSIDGTGFTLQLCSSANKFTTASSSHAASTTFLQGLFSSKRTYSNPPPFRHHHRTRTFNRAHQWSTFANLRRNPIRQPK